MCDDYTITIEQALSWFRTLPGPLPAVILNYITQLEGEKERCARFCEARADRVYAKIKALSEASGCQPTEGILATEFALRDTAERLRNGEQNHE